MMSGVWRRQWEDREGLMGWGSGGYATCHRDRDGCGMAACPGTPRIFSNRQTLEEVKEDPHPAPNPRSLQRE